ncbi:TfoX/Sxy family protein [Microbacterium sp. 4R-513]|uniref:TfoX/Sxy family protein n=1 Tax=Microbacterium sp. 4R-513 TaxID=2567934 RepID=UPI0013E1856C|nr:TfoX/Sxy family protein [Microbacterium sp. 4R-513]QIG38883.1 TfoX/Sxy family protein [Microbacterium sp. 4R-513]
MKDDAERERAHAIFDPIAEEYLTRDGVDIGAMFGSEGLRIRGKVFAFVGFAGGLVVKIPATRADEVEAAGTGHRMEMRGRPAKEWVVVPTSSPEAWAPLMAEAFAFVDEITP